MRFTEFSIPESTQWMEKSDILFLMDIESHEAPYISSAILDGYEMDMESPYNALLDKIHPDDLGDFVEIFNGISVRPGHKKLRIINKSNQTVLFSFYKLKVSGKKNKELLLAISKRQNLEPVVMDIPVNW